jgi:hypothetical protein
LAIACSADAPPVPNSAELSIPSRIDPRSVVRASDSTYRGEVLFLETFDDGAFEERDWYDADQPPRLSTTQHAPGSTGSLECRFASGESVCAQGTPGRRLFTGVEELYVGYWIRYGPGWIGSGKPYHPHEFQFMTNLEDAYAGPAYTHLTILVEQVGGYAQIAITDGRNVDSRCILLNDDTTVGCTGASIATFPFGENRSVAACNGLVGPVQGRDCYAIDGERWYSARTWRTESVALPPATTSDPGWHFVETYVRLNTIRAGEGVNDGAIRHWVDGRATLVLDSILLRTGRHADMRINQVLIAPYIGDGSPIDQTLWIDELTVARGTLPR